MRLLRYASSSFGPLANNQAHVFAARHAVSLYNQRAIYTFIPKNGCSNLRYAAAKANGAISSQGEFEWVQENNYTFQATLRELATAEYTFVVLRCPYRRLVSAYVDKLTRETWRIWRVRRAQPRQGAWDMAHRLVARVDSKLAQRMPAIDFRSFTFRQFVRLLSSDRALMSDHHWAPQTRFLVYSRYDDVFALERFEACEQALARKIGLQLEDTRAFSGHTTTTLKRVADRNYADEPIGKVLEMGGAGVLPAFEAFYDDELKAAVSRLFADDIAFYAEHIGPETLLYSA